VLALPRFDMNGTLRLVAMVLIVVAAIALLSMCGEGVCTACVQALWHGADRSSALRSVVMAVAAALGAPAIVMLVSSVTARSRYASLPEVPLLRVANLRI